MNGDYTVGERDHRVMPTRGLLVLVLITLQLLGCSQEVARCAVTAGGLL